VESAYFYKQDTMTTSRHNFDVFSHVKAHVPILEVVQEYVSIKRSGSYWKGYSPFRTEQIPSFTVSPDKGIYYCFSTNIGGDVIHFLAHMENCSQYEAAQHLMEKFHLAPEHTEQDTGYDAKKRYHLACSVFATWCHNRLQKSQEALAYLYNRGFDSTTLEQFQIGYCPARKRMMREFLPFARKHGVSEQDVYDAHIIKSGHYGAYTPFEERIIFPIADHFGHVCGFGGRTWLSEDTRAKYYNSQEHAYFHKRSLLYNLKLAKSYIPRDKHVYLVEGYTDCLAMATAGYYNSVATLGTACTKEHLELISRYANTVYVLYDGDTAGQQALLRLTQLCWSVDIQLYVVPLHAGEDPATLLADNTLSQRLTQAGDIFQYYITYMGSEFLQKPLQQRVSATRDVFKTIAHISDPLKRDLLLQQAAQTFDIPLETLYKEMSPSMTSKAQREKQTKRPQFLLEKCIVYSTLFYEVPENHDIPLIEHFLPEPACTLFRKTVDYKKSNDAFNFSTFFDTLEREEQRVISKITAECEAHTQGIAPRTLLQQFYKKKWKELVNRVKSHAQTGQSDAYEQALRDLYALKYHMVRRGHVWQPNNET